MIPPSAPRHSPCPDARTFLFGHAPLTIADLVQMAQGRCRVGLDPDPEYRARLARNVASLHEQVRAGNAVYGVTTGVGSACTNAVASGLIELLPMNLVRFHGCGTGAPLPEIETAAVLVARLASLCRGYSGVRPMVLERLCDLLNRGVLPVIPSEGSVGASGDLTPLSYVAAVLTGEREVHFRGRHMSAGEAFAETGLEPIALAPKESLSLMNGTSVMTALACLAHARAERLGRLSCAITALMSEALDGNPQHFDPRIFELKPHPGQSQAARWIREDLGARADRGVTPGRAIQDRYSLRCAPHVVGVLLDALDFSGRVLEIELNGVNDNPIVLSDPPETLHGGNFYGGHVGFVADALKIAISSVADLLDRQVALACNPTTNNGLPADLVARPGAEAAVHHGFKAMQITASALAAEALRMATPATVFSRSTESHNQDKVSMGTIAARDCLRVLELSETVAAVALLTACQARDLRGGDSRSKLFEFVRTQIPRVEADRRQDVDIAKVLELLRADILPLEARIPTLSPDRA